jgi:hypothetical protein
VTQPFDQQAKCEAAGKLDESIGEFWLENPWQPSDKNLSAYERNRVLINGRHEFFIDASHATGGADMDSDSRSVVAGDFNEDGMPDLLIRNSGGEPLRLFLNRFPKTNWIQLTLEGNKSNSRGIGARITATIAGMKVPREMQSQNCFLGQSPALLHIGMGQSAAIDQLTIQWPSGETQTFTDVLANARYVARESDSSRLFSLSETITKPTPSPSDPASITPDTAAK